MATAKFRMPTADEEEIIRRNGVDPAGISIITRDENTIFLRQHKTGDDLMIIRGLRPWGNWRNDTHGH